MSVLERVSLRFVDFVERFYPDAFVFAVLISFGTFALVLGLTETGPVRALSIWGAGLTGLLGFMAQIAITLVAAHALAHTDLVDRILRRAAGWPDTDRQAYALVAAVGGLGSLFAWALGLVVGALFAVEVAKQCRRRRIVVHFPLLVASGYAGFVVWHMGYSSSAALFVATPGHTLEGSLGIIPVTETIFAAWNVALALATVAAVSALCAAMSPRRGQIEYRGSDETKHEVEGSGALPPATFGSWLESRRWLSIAMGAVFLGYLALGFAERGFQLTLDSVNWSFLGLGLLLARSPLHYARLVSDAGRTLGPIILQYPFYAGIMALMTETELVTILSGAFTKIATAETLGFWAFLAGGFVNFFIPSGGGQWVVQGPIFAEAARELGVSYPVVVMGVAYGDQWSNMIQPFWTIPILAIAGLGMRAVMGYCVVVFAATFLLFGGALLLVGAG
jgi:short-chain fatty acids transporter